MSITQTTEIQCDSTHLVNLPPLSKRCCGAHLVFEDEHCHLSKDDASAKALDKGWSVTQHQRHGKKHYCPWCTTERKRYAEELKNDNKIG